MKLNKIGNKCSVFCEIRLKNMKDIVKIYISGIIQAVVV